jgi:hypothetical protein
MVFRCVCCKDAHDESQATLDEQLGGPVCDDCRQLIRGGLAWLKKCTALPDGSSVSRPLNAGDITPANHKRFDQ